MSLMVGLDPNSFWSSAVMGRPRKKVYTDGVLPPFWTNGVVARELGITPPPNPPTFNANINGALAAGTYKFQIVYRRNADATLGNGSPSSVDMTAAANPGDGIRINIPADGALQAGIDKVEIYRTLVGGTMLFYDGVVSYNGTAITYDSTKADSALGIGIETDNGIPPSRPYLIAAFNQLTFWGSKTYNKGTVAVTNGSTTVIGTGTNWNKSMVDKSFKVEGDDRFYTISAFVSATGLTLSTAYVGSTVSGKAYTITLDPLACNWSNIDKFANIKPEAYPVRNYDIIQGMDNEKGVGIGTTMNAIILFTNFGTYVQNRIGANTRVTRTLMPGVGGISQRLITNEAMTGDCIFMSNTHDILRTNGSPGNAANLTEHFISSILNGTHEGIHRNLRHDVAKIDKAHMLYYPDKNWLMIFIVLAGSGAIYPNCCLVMDMKINPFGQRNGPSPWMLWTIPTAVSSGLIPDDTGILRPHFGDDLGFYWKMDSGANDGVPSGTDRGIATGITATTLTDIGASFYTAGDGLKGVRVRTFDANGNIRNDQVIQSNTATELVVTSWDALPNVGDTYTVGAILLERYTKLEDDGVPNRVKVSRYLHLTYNKAASSRNLKVHHFVDGSSTPEIAAGQNVDVSVGVTDRISIRARGWQNQLKFSNYYPDEPITLKNYKRDVTLGGNK